MRRDVIQYEPMKLFHHAIHFPHILRNKQLAHLDLFILLHTVGRSLIGIFIPIILYTSGFTLAQVILYLLIYNAIDVPLNFVARSGVKKFGAREMIIIGIIAEIAYFALLYHVSFQWSILLILALFGAIYDTFYWVGHWFIFNECVTAGKGVGKATSLFINSRRLAGFLAPGIGALCLIFVSKEWLIVAAILFFVVSLIPLFKIDKKYLKPARKQKTSSFLKSKESKRNLLSIILYGVHAQNEGVILPLFIFLTFTSIGSVGLLPMITAFGAIILTYYIGNLSDKYNRFHLMTVGAFALGIFWVLRLIFPNMSMFLFTTLLVGFFSVLIYVPLETRLAENGKRVGMLDTATYRNTTFMIVHALLYAALYIVLNVFHVSFMSAAFSLFLLGTFGLFASIGSMKKTV